jgi:diadenosine tetraphosphate (Ap4A) HIT family hydrolase
MAHATLEKFGYPASLIREYGHWAVALRAHQATLGALVLIAKSDARSFAALPAGAFAEMGTVAKDIEAGLAAFRPYQKINYLMFMMVDPQVHFHVLPRYARAEEFGGLVFEDRGWPALPDMAGGLKPGPNALAVLAAALKAAWPA